MNYPRNNVFNHRFRWLSLLPLSSASHSSLPADPLLPLFQCIFLVWKAEASESGICILFYPETVCITFWGFTSWPPPPTLGGKLSQFSTMFYFLMPTLDSFLLHLSVTMEPFPVIYVLHVWIECIYKLPWIIPFI